MTANVQAAEMTVPMRKMSARYCAEPSEMKYTTREAINRMMCVSMVIARLFL